MKLLVFSDIHGDSARLEKLLKVEADAYVAAGDLSSWGRGLERAGTILRARGERVFVLPGNHESAAQIEDFCRKFGLRSFHEQSFEADGVHVAGLGYSNPTPFDTPGEYSEEEIARRLEAFARLDPLALICHCPPHGTELDEIRRGRHAGSTAVRKFVDLHQPRFFICGHIHEAEGVIAELGKTRAANAGKCGVLLDTSAGTLVTLNT